MAKESQKEKINLENKKYVIICEGRDEKRFLNWYLKSGAFEMFPSLWSSIQVVDFGGNDELSKELKALKLTSGFDQVEALLIIRDAEKDANAATDKIKKLLENNSFPIPPHSGVWAAGTPNVGFLLFPACSREPINGTLEDLCLSILKEPTKSDVLKEIEAFLQELKQKKLRDAFPRDFKTKLHTYFSVTDKYVGSKIGEAADAGAFDWSSPNLEPLKNFVLEKMG